MYRRRVMSHSEDTAKKTLLVLFRDPLGKGNEGSSGVSLRVYMCG